MFQYSWPRYASNLLEANKPIWIVEREARLENYATTMHVIVDTSR